MRQYLDGPNFGARFTTLFTESAYRLELRDHYAVDQERVPFQRFLQGMPADPEWRRPWATFVRRAVDTGRTMQRVHVVTEPLSDYLRFELTMGYPASTQAGEDIRIMQYGAASTPAHDYWLLDDRWVLAMIYDDEGRWGGADLTDEPDEVARHQRWRDLALEHSTPVARYLNRMERRTA